ncbi:ribosome hibernation factor-recruiting GTPase MRF [Nocardia harenae]|uniref:ribosome hibernation factor-recruiting GTPase MRF n=1 Tax=Nocardia harenae TaxID=358707 RepID=UPI00082B1208|nr:GTP-binding protein [Nocardia harenae]
MAESVPASDRRTPVVLLTGTGPRGVPEALLRAPGTVVVRHDLRDLREGVVRRTVLDGDRAELAVLELAHGCVSCTLRGDLLPLLRTLAARERVRRIVLDLDAAFEAAAVCEAIEHVVVAGIVGRPDAPASRDVRVHAVLGCLDESGWFADATGDDTLAERGLTTVDDDRTVAQVALAHVESADALLIAGSGDPVRRVRTEAVLHRLAPGVPALRVEPDAEFAADSVVPAGHGGSGAAGTGPEQIFAAELEALLAAVPARTRGGFDPHAPLLRGQPPLSREHGVEWVEFAADRPFHPARLHEALDVLLEGVVTARGRIWLATQPADVVWLESAGGGLRVGGAGHWLAAMTPAERAAADPERAALAALRWDERFGDRHISLVVLVHHADPAEIRRALHWALVEDDELLLVARSPQVVAGWEDPFGEQHTDPCAGPSGVGAESLHREDNA